MRGTGGNVSESFFKCVEAADIGGSRDIRVALETAPSLLKTDEVVLEARRGGAILPGPSGMGGLLVLLTDSRILMLIPSGWGGKNIETMEIPFKTVTSVGVTRMSGSSYADVNTPDGHVLLSLYGLEPQEVVTRIQWLIDQMSEASTATPTADPLDRLKKLSELRDQGVVSEEEYQEKRRVLLDEV